MSADLRPTPIVLAREAPFTLGGCEVRPATLEVVAGPRRETLEPRVMQVLTALAHQRGEVVSREDLIRSCWGGRIVGEDSINRCIFQLRRLAERLGGFAIETLPRVGYRLTAQVAAVPSEKPSIAVLPFANLAGDPDQDYFADGMVIEIVTALSRFPTLFVIASNSSLTYRDRASSRSRIAQELGVRYLLDGAVRRSGERVRISVQLLDAPDNAPVWTERFEGTLEDVFALQDTVANAVAAQIAPAVEAAEVRHASARPTADLCAYELYLRAFQAARPWTEDAFRQAIDLLEECIARDPDYALALAYAARCYGNVATWWSDDPQESRATALEFGRRALRLAPDDPDVLIYVAMSIALCGGDLGTADVMVERALVRNPGSAPAWWHSGFIKLWGGRAELGLAHLETAERLDPCSPTRPILLTAMGFCLLFLGRVDEAVLRLREAVGLLPTFPNSTVALVAALAHANRIAEARDALNAVGPGQIDRMLGLLRDARYRDVLCSGLALAGADI